MKSNKVLDVIVLILKILVVLAIVFSVAATGFFSFRLVQSFCFDWENANDEGYHSGTGLYIFVTAFLTAAVSAGILFLNTIGMLISCFYKRCPKRKKHLKFFGFCYIAPVMFHLLYIALIAVFCIF
jgi:hypothetical protein